MFSPTGNDTPFSSYHVSRTRRYSQLLPLRSFCWRSTTSDLVGEVCGRHCRRSKLVFLSSFSEIICCLHLCLFHMDSFSCFMGRNWVYFPQDTPFFSGFCAVNVSSAIHLPLLRDWIFFSFIRQFMGRTITKGSFCELLHLGARLFRHSSGRAVGRLLPCSSCNSHEGGIPTRVLVRHWLSCDEGECIAIDFTEICTTLKDWSPYP